MNILVDLYFLEADCQKGDQLYTGGFVFFGGGLPENGDQFFLGEGCDHHRNYGMVVILLSFLCNYDNVTLKLHQGKHATLMMDSILLAYSKMEVYQECYS